MGTFTFLGLIVALLVVKTLATADDTNYDKEKDSAYWRKVADDELKLSLKKQHILGKAKNVIMYIGDGMGPATVTAGRILEGQKTGGKGEEHRLSFDKFPHTGLAVTYNVNTQITDSAASATAYTSGVKTNQGMLGLNAKAQKGNCTSAKGNEVDSILRWFLDEEKSAGVVTTTTVTHATPGSTYSHTPHRDWEVDTLQPQKAKDQGCKDIAWQLINDNPDINVVMGGGMNHFKPKNYTHPRPDKSSSYKNYTRGREDGKDLTQEWIDKKKQNNQNHKFVSTKSELDAVDVKKTDYLFGLFTEFHMAYEIDRDPTLEPSLAEMTEKAIKVLQKNNKGFFLMVEGGRIDHGHHDTKPAKALNDVISFSKAVEVGLKLTDESDTLILVTADHSHTMMVAGYASRGNPILGKSDYVATTDGLPYTTIVYGNGPGYNSSRQNLTHVNTAHKEYVSQSAVPMEWETHGGEDVAMYARGPQSFLYTGVHENNYIPMLMAYAACVGQYKNDCPHEEPNASIVLQSPPVAFFALAFVLVHLLRH